MVNDLWMMVANHGKSQPDSRFLYEYLRLYAFINVYRRINWWYLEAESQVQGKGLRSKGEGRATRYFQHKC
jgi:hypothetical protein